MQLPRYETPDPPGVVGTYGDRVIAWAARELDIELGEWQQRVIRRTLRYNDRGDIIARRALWSTGRQNGKSVAVRSVLGWMLDEGRCLEPFREWTLMLTAAHDAAQARVVYSGVLNDLAGIDRLREQTKGDVLTRNAKLTEFFGIRVGNLSLDIATGQPGSQRGKSPGLIAWDEVLTQRDHKMMGVFNPAMVAQRSPLMLMTSTAGDPDSVVLKEEYDKLVRYSTGAEKADPSFYGAWWQSEDPTPREDWDAIGQANPALMDGRLSRDFIVGELAGPPDIFKQERLNHWLEVRGAAAVNPAKWAACRQALPLADAPGPFALAVDLHPDRERATVAASGIRTDGRVGVEIVADLRGGPVSNEDILSAIHDFTLKQAVIAIAVDRISGFAPEAARDAESSGLPYDILTAGMVVDACQDAAEMIEQRKLAIDDPLVDAQVPNAVRRNVGTEGAFRFTRTQSTGPIDAFMAVVFAAHAVVWPARGAQVFF